MKKWIIAIVITLVVSLACVYIFIPSVVQVTSLGMMHCNPPAVFRQTGQRGNWIKWWPGGSSEESGQQVYRFGGDVYHMSGSSYPLTEVTILHDGSEIKTKMSVISLPNKDSAAILWQCDLSGGVNPIQRLRQYLFARHLKGSMDSIVLKLRPYLENERNIYGMSVGWGGTKDTFLVATKTFFTYYPGTADIYRQLGKLREYISKQGAVESGYPMDNVTKMSDSGFNLMVAVPTNRPLPEKGDIFYRRLVPAKFLIAEVKGGDSSVKTGWKHFHEYVEDHQRTVMAIPWEYLVTDRVKETDTAKWSTWLYYPVF